MAKKIEHSIQDKLRMRKERSENRGNDNSADWETVEGALVLRLIASSSSSGLSTSFGYTKDGGAYTLSFYDWSSGERFTEYCSPNVDVDGWLRSLLSYLFNDDV